MSKSDRPSFLGLYRKETHLNLTTWNVILQAMLSLASRITKLVASERKRKVNAPFGGANLPRLVNLTSGVFFVDEQCRQLVISGVNDSTIGDRPSTL